MRDERGGSEVYDVRKEKKVRWARVHYPRRGVNKYMHKREIDARLGEIGWKGGWGNEPRLCTWHCRLVHKLPKMVGEKERMEIGARRVIQCGPAANRDSDSYKQPLLASSRVMIGLMRHLDGQDPSVFKSECARESRYAPQVTASFINSYRQPTARDSGHPCSHLHRMYLALEQSTTHGSMLRMLNHLDPLQVLEKMARVVEKMDPAVLAGEKGWGSRATPVGVGRLRAWGA